MSFLVNIPPFRIIDDIIKVFRFMTAISPMEDEPKAIDIIRNLVSF